MADPRVLVLTPDFPPRHGGIQVLVHRVVASMRDFQPRVVTLGAIDGADPVDDVATRRVAEILGSGAASKLELNRVAFTEGLRLRPQVVLSAHIIVSPAAAALAAILGIPFVQYFHAKEIGARRQLAGFAAGRAAASIAVSRYTRDLVLEVGGAAERIRRIPPGVDVPAALPAVSADRPTILTIARLEDRYKGHDVLLRAMPLVRARIPDARWVAIGDGPLRAPLSRTATQMGLGDGVQFVGAVSDDERDAWLGRAHVFAMPSRLPAGGFAGEGFGIVYLEAGAHGLPVVAGNVGGALDSVLDGRTGLLVDPTDHVALAEALCRLLTDRTLAAELGQGGRAHAQELAWPRIAARVEALLHEVCGA